MDILIRVDIFYFEAHVTYLVILSCFSGSEHDGGYIRQELPAVAHDDAGGDW